MPKKPAPRSKPLSPAGALLRVAVQLESQGEAIERIEALAHDQYDLLRSIAELLRQQISASAPRQPAP